MGDEPRRKWAVFSGLTRREQHVLVFLIAVIAAGIGYNEYTNSRQRQPLTLHRADPGQSNAVQSRPMVAAPDISPRTTRADRATSPIIGKAPTQSVGNPGLPDINRATADQLDTLPGVGPVRAAAIIQYRNTHGPFVRLEDLRQVSGIGPKTFERIRPYLKPLEGPTSAPLAKPPAIGPPPKAAGTSFAPPAPGPPGMVNLNTATIEELCTLSGIESVLAQRIVAYRRMNGPFQRASDIQKVKGIGRVTFEKNPDRLTVGPPGR